MRKLLDFLLEKKHWFLLILFEVISFTLIYRNNSYQRSVMINSANYASGYVLSVAGYVQSYLNLRTINRNLQEQNGQMEMQLLDLQEQIEVMQADTVTFKGAVSDSARIFPFQFVIAEVVNNSISQLSNYITINKGRKDGIQPDMGVVSEQGVVGIVSNVSDHFSVIISLLNPKSKLSCKVLGNNSFGYLTWDGRDAGYAILEELPRHAEFHKGDTIVNITMDDFIREADEIRKHIDISDIREYEKYAGVDTANKTFASSTKPSFDISNKKDVPTSEELIVKNKELEYSPTNLYQVEFYLSGQHDSIYISVNGQKVATTKDIKNYKSNSFKIENAGEYQVDVFDRNLVCSFKIKVSAPIEENDLGI